MWRLSVGPYDTNLLHAGQNLLGERPSATYSALVVGAKVY